MERAHETFQDLLQRDPDVSGLVWTIRNRETLFSHLRSLPVTFRGRSTYSIRVDGALESLGGFVSLVKQARDIDNEYPRWESMIWGSFALVLAEFYQRTAGQEQILGMLEELTVTPSLPCSPFPPDWDHIQRIVFHLFSEVSIQLLKLALELRKYQQGKARSPRGMYTHRSLLTMFSQPHKEDTPGLPSLRKITPWLLYESRAGPTGSKSQCPSVGSGRRYQRRTPSPYLASEFP